MRKFAIAAAAAYVMLAILVRRRSPLDEWISDAAGGVHWWRTPMRVITHTGDTAVVVLLGVVVIIVLLWRRQYRRLSYALICVVSGSLIRLATLPIVHRPRPGTPLTAVHGWSFPSGHTTSTTLAAGALAMMIGTRAALMLLVWPLLVGISRIALLAHWPTDVLAGWLLGAFAVTATFSAPRRGKAEPQALE